MFGKILSIVKSILNPIAKFISTIVNCILLSLVYFVGIGIVSLVMKLFGKHFLKLKKQNRMSNWDDHELTKQPLENYYRTF